jgi:Cdc6-like AAA superfamily ATPase
MPSTSQEELFFKFKTARESISNPFRIKSIVTATEIWGTVQSEIASLHLDAEKTILGAIRNIKDIGKVGILISADAGIGKSHLIHRIRENLESKGLGIFAYIPPITEPNRPDFHVRYHLVDSFTRQNDLGISQWEIIAARLIGTVKAKNYSKYFELSNDIPALREFILIEHKFMTHFEMMDFIEKLASEITRLNRLKKDFVKAVLLLLFENEKESKFADAKAGALSWLQGSDDEERISAAKLPRYPLDQQQAVSVSFISELCLLAEAVSLPVVICFDQLDNFVPSFDCKHTPSQVAAFCVDRLHLQCQNIVLIISAVTTRLMEINALDPATLARVSERRISLNPPSASEMYELVRQRLDWFFKKADLDLNVENLSPYYPFQESEIVTLVTNLEKGKGNLRDLVNKCADLFEQAGGKPPKTDLELFLESYEQNLLSISENKPQKNDDEIAEILRFCLTHLHEESGGVKASRIDTGKDIHMIICGYDSSHNKDVRIGVRVCNTGASATFNAVMSRILDYSKNNLTRGCLVRSEPIRGSWNKGIKLRDELLVKQGEVVVLKENELIPLIAIYQIFQQNQEKDKILGLIKDSRIIVENPLIQEILSAPND